MSEEVQFEYKDDFCQDFIIIYQRLTKKHVFKMFIPITECIDWEIDEFDIWDEKIYEKCPNRYIPDEYLELEDYYENPDNPKMTKNVDKHEFCSIMDNTDDYSCCMEHCPLNE